METFEKQIVDQYVFYKQHLSKDSRAEKVLQVVRDIVGLHATSVSTPYLSLYARMKGFQREHLNEELYVKRNLIRLKSMRGTLFIFPTEFANSISGDETYRPPAAQVDAKLGDFTFRISKTFK